MPPRNPFTPAFMGKTSRSTTVWSESCCVFRSRSRAAMMRNLLGAGARRRRALGVGVGHELVLIEDGRVGGAPGEYARVLVCRHEVVAAAKASDAAAGLVVVEALLRTPAHDGYPTRMGRCFTAANFSGSIPVFSQIFRSSAERATASVGPWLPSPGLVGGSRCSLPAIVAREGVTSR